MIGMPSKDFRERNIWACPASAAEIRRAGGPCQSEPEMIVFVSMTSFTSSPLPPNGVHFGLDFLHRHGIARMSTNAIQNVLEPGGRFTAGKLTNQQVSDRR